MRIYKFRDGGGSEEQREGLLTLKSPLSMVE